MSQAVILEMSDGFAQAARRGREARFDGVEAWAACHGFFDQFWPPGRTGARIAGAVHWKTARGYGRS